ncbi:MAG: histidine kinase [Caulobacteraceae bacterium]|nr:histidine kinase [Caulobacteraceae bacterium]
MRLSRAEEALAQETRRSAALIRIAASINGGGDLEGVVQAVIDGGVELTGAQFGAFFYNRVNAEGESYTLYALSGAPRSAFSDFPMPRNTKVFAPTFTGEGVVRSDDITADPRYGQMAPHYGMPPGHLPVRSYLAASVLSRDGEVIGGLFFGHAQAGVFDMRSEAVLIGLAAQAAVAIEAARLHEAALRELGERRAAEERQRLLLNELNHRVKNTLAAVQSIAFQTLRSARTPFDFRTAFEARLMALSQTHNLLTERSWKEASLADIVEVEMEPHGPDVGRFLLHPGAEVRLNPKAAVALGMAIHELATNAAKYGALSTARGRVEVRWTVKRKELRLDWRERGGPMVSPPQRRGFGSRLLERGLAGELSGEVSMHYEPEGLRCTMRLPMTALEPQL